MKALRIALIGLMALLVGVAPAGATILGPVPYIFSNGTPANATQVNADFSWIINGVNTNVIFPAFTQQSYYAADTSLSANSLTVTLSPAPILYAPGMVIYTLVANTNTGASTINANSLGSVSITNLDGSALKGSQLLSGFMAGMVYDGTEFELFSLTPLAIRQSATSRTTQIFTSPSSWTFTIPVGVYWVKIEAWSGGGGGGGGSTSTAMPAAGGSGAFGRMYVSVSPGDVLSGVLGAGGTGGTTGPTSGGTGGSTTILKNGVTIGTLTGGVGGGGANSCCAAGGLGGAASGTWAMSMSGQTGGPATFNGTSPNAGGSGGSAPQGGPGGVYLIGTGCGNGGNPGGGGGGPIGSGAGCPGGNGWVYLEY